MEIDQSKFLEAVIQTASDLIMTIDEEGLIYSCNKTAMKILGYEPAEMIGKPFYFFLAEIYQQDYQNNRRNYLAGLESDFIGVGRRIEALKKDGNLVPISLTFSEVPFEKVHYLSAVIRDITKILNTEIALEKMARELALSNAKLEQFAALAAHDLQAPLRTITGFTERLQQRYAGNLSPEADDYITRINAATGRMQTMIVDLLVLSRLGTHKKVFKPVNTEVILTHILSDLAASIAESKALITNESLPSVMGDEGQLRQLLQNLVLNAIKFRKPSMAPEIHIRVERQPQQWQFCVTDNGIGIAERFYEKIFQAFQRLHGKHEYPGTGLGLAICQKIVENHGGRLWVESQEN